MFKAAVDAATHHSSNVNYCDQAWGDSQCASLLVRQEGRGRIFVRPPASSLDLGFYFIFFLFYKGCSVFCQHKTTDSYTLSVDNVHIV